MTALSAVLLILALVFFLVAAVVGYSGTEGRPPGWHRTNFVALGLACWVATEVIALLVH